MRIPSILFLFLSVFTLPLYADKIAFYNALTGKPLAFKYRTEQIPTEAVDDFHKTGKNAYSGDEKALADGKKSIESYVRLVTCKTAQAELDRT